MPESKDDMDAIKTVASMAKDILIASRKQDSKISYLGTMMATAEAWEIWRNARDSVRRA